MRNLRGQLFETLRHNLVVACGLAFAFHFLKSSVEVWHSIRIRWTIIESDLHIETYSYHWKIYNKIQLHGDLSTEPSNIHFNHTTNRSHFHLFSSHNFQCALDW